MNKKVISIALVLVLFISFGSIIINKKYKYDEVNHKRDIYKAKLILKELNEREKNQEILRILLIAKTIKVSIYMKIEMNYEVAREFKELEELLKRYKGENKSDIYEHIALYYNYKKDHKMIEKYITKDKNVNIKKLYIINRLINLNEKSNHIYLQIKWLNEYRGLINSLTSIKENQRIIEKMIDIDLEHINLKFKILELKRVHLRYFVVFIIIIMTLTLIIIIHEYRKKKVKNEILKNNIEILNKQLQYQWKHYNDIKKHQDEVKRHWHDIKRHSSLILNLIENEEYEKAKDYIKSITENISEVENKKISKNKIIDAILSSKIEECNLKNINLTMDIKIPEILNINDFDICVIFGNILDNAIEACENINNNEIEKYIDIKSKLINKQLYIYIENSRKGDIIEKENKFITSKKDKYNHGLGLESVKKSIEKYNGKIRINYDKNIFKLSILMKN